MAANYVLLGEITTSVATASVTFSNIPQTGYTDLVIKSSTRADGGFGAAQFNGDTGSNYSSRFIRGNGTSAASSTQTTFIFAATGDPSFTANQFASAEMTIANYNVAGINKVGITDAVDENNGSTNYMPYVASYWTGTAAISSIRLYCQSGGSFVAGSTFYLYGVAKLGTDPVIAPKASGGDIVVNDGTYWYHAFLSSGTFTPSQNLSCDVLQIAGGGGGSHGGGGAGGLLYYSAQSLISTNYACTIGAGGSGAAAAHNARGTNGSNSQFASLTASVGGGTGGQGQVGINQGLSGGSGGGSAQVGASQPAGGSGTIGQGNNGGTAGAASGFYAGGGGGGAGAVGGNGNSATGTGPGGVGSSTYSSWGSATATGQNVTGTYYYAGGGGAGSDNSGGVAGYGGGGAGSSGTATSATANTGGGGGGSSNTGGGAGGSGIIIVRYTVA